jgi:hypothetical protein
MLTLSSALPHLPNVSTDTLTEWLRRTDIPARDADQIEQELTNRLAADLVVAAKASARRAPAGWYDVPNERGTQRWWDGQAWTARQRRAPKRRFGG